MLNSYVSEHITETDLLLPIKFDAKGILIDIQSVTIK